MSRNSHILCFDFLPPQILSLIRAFYVQSKVVLGSMCSAHNPTELFSRAFGLICADTLSVN